MPNSRNSENASLLKSVTGSKAEARISGDNSYRLSCGKASGQEWGPAPVYESVTVPGWGTVMCWAWRLNIIRAIFDKPIANKVKWWENEYFL